MLGSSLGNSFPCGLYVGVFSDPDLIGHLFIHLGGAIGEGRGRFLGESKMGGRNKHCVCPF